MRNSVISSQVDNGVFFSFSKLIIITILLNPFPRSSFVPINHPCVFLISDQEGSDLEASQLSSHGGSVIICQNAHPCTSCKNGTTYMLRERNLNLVGIFVSVSSLCLLSLAEATLRSAFSPLGEAYLLKGPFRAEIIIFKKNGTPLPVFFRRPWT